jgi:hypothetical protein
MFLGMVFVNMGACRFAGYAYFNVHFFSFLGGLVKNCGTQRATNVREREGLGN